MLGVESIYLFHFSAESEFLFVPEGKMELIIQNEGAFAYKPLTAKDWKIRPSVFIGGMHSTAFLVKSLQADGRLLSIKFQPDRSGDLCGGRADLFRNLIVPTVDVFGTSGLMLCDDIWKANTSDEKLRCALKFVADNRKDADHRFSQIFEDCYHSIGRQSVSDRAAKVHLSPSHFRKIFREKVGLSPREYSKIVRINYAAQEVHRGIRSLTDIAYSLGYFDQSHFIKEFRSVLKVSPGAYASIPNKIDLYN